MISAIGRYVIGGLERAGYGTRLFVRLVLEFFPLLRRPRLVTKQIHFLGNYSFVIIAVSGLFVGFVLGLQGYYTLNRYGSEQALGLLVALSLVRELGPVGIAAVAGETASDRQLKRFLADPDHGGQVCRAGWWRYSRHPNYFFECVHWLAYTALAIGMPWGWLTLFPPLLMAWLLLKVSGLPLLEARLVQSRPGYREYMRTTSAIVPWPPRPAPGPSPTRSDHPEDRSTRS